MNPQNMIKKFLDIQLSILLNLMINQLVIVQENGIEYLVAGPSASDFHKHHRQPSQKSLPSTFDPKTWFGQADPNQFIISSTHGQIRKEPVKLPIIAEKQKELVLQANSAQNRSEIEAACKAYAMAQNQIDFIGNNAKIALKRAPLCLQGADQRYNKGNLWQSDQDIDN